MNLIWCETGATLWKKTFAAFCFNTLRYVSVVLCGQDTVHGRYIVPSWDIHCLFVHVFVFVYSFSRHQSSLSHALSPHRMWRHYQITWLDQGALLDLTTWRAKSKIWSLWQATLSVLLIESMMNGFEGNLMDKLESFRCHLLKFLKIFQVNLHQCLMVSHWGSCSEIYCYIWSAVHFGLNVGTVKNCGKYNAKTAYFEKSWKTQ